MSEQTKTVTSKTVDIEPAKVVVPKSTTNWKIFEEGRFIPVQWKCEGYQNFHPADLSCHSNMKITPEDILRHMDPAHGGGWFRVKFRISDSKVSPIWSALSEACVELNDFYCTHCRSNVPLTPREIVKHLQPHAGATRINMFPQTLAMTLSLHRAEELNEWDELYEDRLTA